MAKKGFNLIDNIIIFLTVTIGYIYDSTFSFAYPICISILYITFFLCLFKFFSYMQNRNIHSVSNWSLSALLLVLGGVIVTISQIGKAGIDSYFIVPLILGMTLAFSNTKKIQYQFLMASIICFTLHFILYFSGIIQDPIQMIRIKDSSVLIRSTLGFNHPNAPFRFFLPIVLLLYLLVSEKKFKWIVMPALLLQSIYIYQETDSRTAFYLLLLLFIIIFLGVDKIFKYKLPLFISKYMFWLIAGISIIMAIMCGDRNNAINIVLTDRLYMWRLCFENGIKLFGGSNLSEGIYIDNSSIFLLVQCGLIPFLIVGCLYSRFIKFLINKRDYKMCVVVLIFLVMSFAENIIFRYSTNFIIILAFKYVFEYEWSKGSEIILRVKPGKISKYKRFHIE